MSDENEKPILYAVASEKPVGYGRNRTWIPEIVYCHAVDAAHARWIFTSDPHHRGARIVAIAPAVGYHVNDEHGEQLSA